MLPKSLRAQFAAAIRRLIRPVVRQLIAYGVSYPAFNEIVKQLFVEVAEQDFALPFKKQTDSRLALVTGLSRKEVSQLRRQRNSWREPPEVEDTVATHVIGRWMAGPPYATPDGAPRRLRYEADDPREPSFARIVREMGVDIPVRAVLDELLRVGSVVLRPNGDVELLREAHIPESGTKGKLALLGSDPAELFSTIIHNIEHADAPWVQRKVVYDNIGSEGLDSLRDEAGSASGDFIRRANALVASYDRDRRSDAPGGSRTRVVLSVYYYQEPVEVSEEPEAGDAARLPPGRIRRKK